MNDRGPIPLRELPSSGGVCGGSKNCKQAQDPPGSLHTVKSVSLSLSHTHAHIHMVFKVTCNADSDGVMCACVCVREKERQTDTDNFYING